MTEFAHQNAANQPIFRLWTPKGFRPDAWVPAQTLEEEWEALRGGAVIVALSVF